MQKKTLPIGIDTFELTGRQRRLTRFAQHLDSGFVASEFHTAYYKLLDAFTAGTVKKLIVSAPPQHGKSTGSTIFTPANILGRRPRVRLAVASYSATLATKFSRAIQRVMRSDEYASIFPEASLKVAADFDVRRQNEFETPTGGSLMAVGRGGGLTGNPVDVILMDDLYSGPEEANSPVIREGAWEWYTDVARARLHNDSQELIVFTRWHEHDIIGKLQEKEPFFAIEWTPQLDIAEVLAEYAKQPRGTWLKVNFRAILPSGVALWEARHSIEKLQDSRKLNPVKFEALYQGNPSTKEGNLYSGFRTYEKLPDTIYRRASYTDPADKGTDFLCSIGWVEDSAGIPHVVDVLFDDRGGEITEPLQADLIDRNDVREAYFEANGGGEAYARAVKKLLKKPAKVIPENQSLNKEAKILTEAPRVTELLAFPKDWATRWPAFYAHMSTFKRVFRSNAHDDGADACTEVVMRCRAYRGGSSKLNTRR